jgi:hypothetical protein
MCRWKDTIKTGFEETFLEGLDWVSLVQDTEIHDDLCEHSTEPLGTIISSNFLYCCSGY